MSYGCVVWTQIQNKKLLGVGEKLYIFFFLKEKTTNSGTLQGKNKHVHLRLKQTTEIDIYLNTYLYIEIFFY